MGKNSNSNISKKLSYILRHCPESIQIELDSNGWTDLNILIEKLNITFQKILDVVNTDNKNRYELNDSKTKIRARQGHSVSIQLNYEYIEPPKYLYHGTSDKNIYSIKENGINKGKRHSVHLSQNKDTAIQVGKRHGNPIILTILSQDMHNHGFKFQLTGNGVWLTEYIPVEYINFN